MGQLTMDVYLKHLKTRYFRADRKGKSRILDEFCATSGLHRKHVIRLLTRTAIGWREKPAGRPKCYTPEKLLVPLKHIWLATDQMCGERLKVALALWLPFYEKKYGPLEAKVKGSLLAMSKATIDRLLRPSECVRGNETNVVLRSELKLSHNGLLL